MFYKPGWKPLHSITREISAYAGLSIDTDPPGADDGVVALARWEHKLYTCSLVYWLLKEAEVACLTPGDISQIIPELVEPITDEEPENDHIDIYVGTIGSGFFTASHSSKPRPRLRDLQEKYGQFLHATVIVKEVDYINFMDKLRGADGAEEPQGEGAKPRRKLLAHQIAKELIKLFDANEFHTRSEAFEILGPNCRSAHQFTQGWREAAKERERMARPGRRPDLKP